MEHRGVKRKVHHDEEDEHEAESASQSSSSEEADGTTSDSEADLSSDEDHDELADNEEKIDVEFLFFFLKDIDFHGLKSLLRTYLDGEEFNGCSELVETIIQQNSVGTVVKTSDDDDPIAVLTALNLQQYGKLGCLKEIYQFLQRKCSGVEQQEKLQKAWSMPATALVVNERLLNCPPQLSPPLQQGLFDLEIPWATEDEPSEDRRAQYMLKHFLFVSRVYQDTTEVASHPGKNKKQKKAEKRPPVLVYARPEDEFYHRHSEWSFTFPVTNRPVAKDELQPLRLVMLLGSDQAAAARKELDEIVGNVATGQLPQQ